MHRAARKAKEHLWADVPVERAADDQLGRSGFAASLAKTIRAMKGTESFVFGICGPWGCGKSSVLRMVMKELESGRSSTKPIIVNFNPWWFSGQEQLLVSFFGQLAAVLGRRDAGATVTKVGNRLGTLAKVLRPIGWIPGAEVFKEAAEAVAAGAEAAKNFGERLAVDVHNLRSEIDEELRKSKRRIVVVMDDIDRLTATEISQLFMIVKAVADFPSTVYLLSFDHAIVCQAIKDKLGLDGPAYLEKIVQIRVDIPPPSPVMLQQMFLTRLGELISPDTLSAASNKDFGNLFHGGIKSFFRTPRSVKSLTNVLRVLYPAVAGEVNWPEFVAITALQVFAPSTYALIRDNPEHFVGPCGDRWGRDEHTDEKVFHEAWSKALPESSREAVVEIVRRLFPKAAWALGGSAYGSDWTSRWKAELRACSPDYFDRYFQLQVPAGGISEAEWKRFVSILATPASADEQIKRWSQESGPNGLSSRAKEFLERASLFGEHGATAEQAEQLLSTILRNGDLLIAVDDEDRSRGLPIDNELRLSWAVQSLLETIPEGCEREAVIEMLLPLAGLSTVTRLVWLFGAQHGRFGSDPNRPHEVRHLSSECVDRLVDIALDKLRSASKDGSLAASHRPLHLARDWRNFEESGAAEEWVGKVCEDDTTFVRFLISVQSTTSSHRMSDRVATLGRSAGADFLVWWFDGIRLRERCSNLLQGAGHTWVTDEMREALELVVGSIDEHGNPLDPFQRHRPQTSTSGTLETDVGPEDDGLEDESEGTSATDRS